MTPTLWGRWQTRFLLLATLGLWVSFIFGFFMGFPTPISLIGYVLLFGLGWDILYNFVQQARWDHDWPPVFQVATGVVEGLFVWSVLQIVNLPGVNPTLSIGWFLTHYSIVWLLVFLASQGPLRIIFPRWRFRGGQWL